MQREDGGLDAEGDKKGERTKPERVLVGGDLVRDRERLEDGEVEGAGADVEPDEGDQQDGGGNEGVEEELERGAAAVFGTAKGGDQDGERDE